MNAKNQLESVCVSAMNNPESLGGTFSKTKKFGDDPHQGLAEFAFPNGGVIGCKKCQVRRNCTTSEIAVWLKEGYPVCRKCGTKTFLE